MGPASHKSFSCKIVNTQCQLCHVTSLYGRPKWFCAVPFRFLKQLPISGDQSIRHYRSSCAPAWDPQTTTDKLRRVVMIRSKSMLSTTFRIFVVLKITKVTSLRQAVLVSCDSCSVLQALFFDVHIKLTIVRYIVAFERVKAITKPLKFVREL